jgi:hypothetical protein
MSAQHHTSEVGVLGAIIGFFAYIVGHITEFLPSIEQAVPALILAAGCSFVGAVTAMFTRWLFKKI